MLSLGTLSPLSGKGGGWMRHGATPTPGRLGAYAPSCQLSLSALLWRRAVIKLMELFGNVIPGELNLHAHPACSTPLDDDLYTTVVMLSYVPNAGVQLFEHFHR